MRLLLAALAGAAVYHFARRLVFVGGEGGEHIVIGLANGDEIVDGDLEEEDRRPPFGFGLPG